MSRKLTSGNHHSSKSSQETTDTKSSGQKFDDKNLQFAHKIYINYKGKKCNLQ